MSLAGAFADFRKSATRAYVNNFEDKGRQNTMDMLLVVLPLPQTFPRVEWLMCG